MKNVDKLHVYFINQILMSHRLQHLHKRKVEPTEQPTSQRQVNEAPNNYSSPQTNNIQNSIPLKPIFNPANHIQPYDKNGYKKGEMPFPPPQSLYASKDTEIDPCFLRATTATLHTQPRKTNLPIGLWITPFANDRVSVVEVRSPLRCTRCKGYVNPYFQFDGLHRAATCNLCGLRFTFQENIDKNNLQSAQIATQSIIDFRVADKFYYKKRTDIIKIIVVVELSMNMIELGIVSTVISSLKSTFQSHEFDQKVKLGIVFYSDNGVGFLRKADADQEPTIFLAPNNKNLLVCSPLCDQEFLFSPNLQREKLCSTLDYLETYANANYKQGKFSHQANYVMAIKSIRESFENETGKIVLFSLLDPRVGSCAIRVRNQQQLKLPLKPLHLEHYQLARQLVRARIGVDHFYFSKDGLIGHQLATTHFLSSITGGQLHLYNIYNNENHSLHLYYSIFHTFTKPTFYDADFTCRSSAGLNVLRYGVQDGLRESRDVGLSTLSSSSSFTVELDQQQKFQQHTGAFIQFALMYTNGKGERRIRIINYKFNVSSNLQTVYDSIDYLTFANIVAKTYTSRLLKFDPIKPRQDAINFLGNIIGEFRAKCPNGRNTRYGDMVVPLNLTWAFAYLHTILNGKLFLSYMKTTSDMRINEYLQIHSSNPYFFANRYYPHVYPLTLDIYEEEPLPGDFIQNQEEKEDDPKIAILPKNLPLSKQHLNDAGVYLYDAADQIIIFVQSQAGEQLLNQLFATTHWQTIQSEGLPELQTSHNIRVNNIIAQIRRRSSQYGGMYQPLLVKTPLKKGVYGQLLHSVLKEDYFDCNYATFMDSIRRAIVVPK